MKYRGLRRATRAAFTLMEMLVVVAIIVALAGIGGYYYFAQLDKANDTRAKAQVRLISKAVETFMTNHNGEPPPSLEILLEPDEMNSGKPYLESLENLIDPWSREYQYDPAGTNNRTLKPDVWAESPRGPIGNWSTR